VPDTGLLIDGETVPARRPYRPPIGIPIERQGRGGAVVSILLHLLIIGLILAPPIFTGLVVDAGSEGGGGAGPAGGGGGGNRGTGGIPERMQYLQVAPAAPVAPPAEVVAPVVLPPEEQPEVVPPRPEPVVPPPTIEPAAVTSPLASAPTVPSTVRGVGGGSGADGSAGSGPGSGGGTGSGIGTGTGSANGPGTGGGDATTYPPTVTALPILPLPVPDKVRPYTMVAYFDVDSLGNATLLSFSPSKDGGYNKRIREMLLEIRFRPAVRGDGRAVRDTAVIRAEAP
jgi:hypothetical protein